MPGEILLLDLTYDQLKELLVSCGEPAYRADQIWRWLYRSLASDFQEMTNLPKGLRERLAEATLLRTMKPLKERGSADGLTRKVLFALRDDQTIESVLMHYERRHTTCISTQVGCALGCVFCATGQSGFVRNLTPGEIVEQVLYFAHLLKAEGERLTNVVLMGMGEPLANYEATWQAIETLTHDDGFNLGARRITISTVGLVPGIRRLAREGTQIGLAVSLHASTDELRDKLIPINRRYPLAQLMAACRHYAERTGRRISFEYALIHGINDSPEQARQLAHLLAGLFCHVNLIPLNPVPESPYQPSPRGRILAFQAELNRLKVPNTLRVERGVDIQAGCGQLRCQRMPSG
ncbi:MAG: 23S rRNA (adenine(2503)-C(2))-methyltransferase RlmN [Chloroflexi bacterium]|nr:23S rRNA (adenine(2503)-C(2))-methyltransferase RlmN [Chloroflexota bacterium]